MEECKYRHENGNCLFVGGFCTSVDKGHCIEEHDKLVRADERAKVIEEVEKLKNQVPVNRLLDNIIEDKPKELGMLIAYDEVLKVLEQQ